MVEVLKEQQKKGVLTFSWSPPIQGQTRAGEHLLQGLPATGAPAKSKIKIKIKVVENSSLCYGLSNVQLVNI